jgi:phospholipid/cholesterol/gamma-HCH transport system permease protein
VADGEGLTFTRADDGTLVIGLGGTWSLRDGVPPVDPVVARIEKEHPGRVAFDGSALHEWDTSLVAFLYRITEACHERRIDTVRDGLPQGAQRLLALAHAVPERTGARRGEKPASFLARVGKATLEGIEGTRDMLAFLGEATLSLGRFITGRAQFRWVDLWLVMQECGAEALPIVTLVSFLIGLIVAFVGAVQLVQFGAQIYVADLVGIAMIREMGAVMTGVIMAGRTGAAFAARIGTMKVTYEIDALTTMAISPIDFLVMPRLMALSLMMPLLCVYADLIGIIGGGVVAVALLDITVPQFMNELEYAITMTSFAIGIAKAAAFGVLIAIAGGLRGLQCGSDSAAVGEAATSAVVTAIVAMVVADGIFAVLCNVLDI